MNVTQIHKSVHRITTPFGDEGVVFLYLLKGDRIALVDTGASMSPRDVLQPALAEMGLALSDVAVILNTHAHLDHAGGNLAVKRASNAIIHVHSADAAMARSTDVQVESMTAPLRVLDFPPEVLKQRAHHVAEMAGESAGVDVVLSEGDVVDLGAGLKLRVVHCPGHTPGSTGYYWESEGMLFTGDSILGHGSRAGAYPLYFSAPDYRRTLAAVARLDPRTLCTAHAYLGSGPINDPSPTGPAAKAFLQESTRVADTFQKAAAEAVRRMPGASKRELALSALSDLVYEVPTHLVRKTGMPRSGGPTILAHIEAALNGSYPA